MFFHTLQYGRVCLLDSGLVMIIVHYLSSDTYMSQLQQPVLETRIHFLTQHQHDCETDLPCHHPKCGRHSKVSGPFLQCFEHTELSVIQHCGHCQKVLLEAVDEWNGKLLVHNLLLCHHNESGNITYFFQQT